MSKRPNGIRDWHLEYLDDEVSVSPSSHSELKQMLIGEFNLLPKNAQIILDYWIETTGQDVR